MRAERSAQAQPSKLRLAIVHDALITYGGAERVVAAWHRRWPEAPIYTSVYLPDHTFPEFRGARVVTSFLQKFARDPQTVIRRLAALMVPGFQGFDFSGYDVVLSSSAYAAKAIRVRDHVCHVCYCYSPLRLAWRPEDYLGADAPMLKRIGLKMLAPLLRRWDYGVSRRVNYFGTTSQHVRRRILAAYGRGAEVIPAPVDLDRYRMGRGLGDYYLIVSRLTRYKRVDLAVQAISRLGRRLVVVGTGPDRSRLEVLAGAGVSFLGNVSEESLLDLYAGCRALLHPQEEDYGLAPLEAMASGRPVVAYGVGGACETVLDGETGVFFMTQSVDSLIRAVESLEATSFDPVRIRTHASRYDLKPFCDRVESFLGKCLVAFGAPEAEASFPRESPELT
jgi:glycosyltransferase involved in cell wall biosynthesis